MDYAKLTPMMKQYLEVKDKYPDTILFYRLGDFYEMFFDDALEASRVLEIALTGRNAGLEEKVPMCGVPYHSAQAYLKKLIDNGYKVAICEQLEEPSAGNKIVRRDVVKIITPGTTLDLEQKDYNYIMFIDQSDHSFYRIALCDLSTGKLKAVEIIKDKQLLYNEILNYKIKEVVINKDFDTSLFNELIKKYKFTISFVEDELISHYLLETIESKYKKAFASLFTYIEAMQMDEINYFMEVEYSKENHLKIDFSSKFNLELISTIKNNEKYGTLFWYLDKTKSAMGSRLLKEFIESPLVEIEEIKKRQDFVEALLDNYIVSQTMIKQMRDIYDLARLAVKVGQRSINPKELIWLANSIEKAQEIVNELSSSNSTVLQEYANNIDLVEDVVSEIKDAINFNLDDLNEKIINDGYSQELDQYRKTLATSTQWLLEFEQRQREITKIKNLKVKYNKVFGYYIEVSNANKNMVKDEFNYVRKQTLTNAERYINTELKEQESLILMAQENVSKLEMSIFNDLKNSLVEKRARLQQLAKDLAYLDVMLAFYQIANQYGYSKPSFNNENRVVIKDSFHPIIKAIDQDRDFINNDIIIDRDINVMLITGPNMGGKSTYMRQLAILVIMAQIGSYIPAAQADMMIFDRIFTRIGASDDLVQGQSTFMVEMLEAANAILNVSDNSLILFDEIGRGTATYDGMAIAWAMIEYLAHLNKAKTLFSTHYHELISLEDSNSNIKNFHASVIDNEQEITFTYKVKPGSINKSYGIHVAKLAHLPKSIIERANQLLETFEKDNINVNEVKYIEVENESNTKLIKELENIDINQITPMQALEILSKLKEQVK